MLSSTSQRIVGDLTFYYHLNTPADNVNGYAGYLGVLRRNTCNGFLAEGYCHTYQPARHRALNPDYCGQEGVRYARGVAAWFNWETEPTGYIMGSVKDLHKVFSHDLYHPNTNSMDIWKPINFAVVSLYKGGEKIAEYTTDGEYNGVFVFENLEPGDDYTIDAVAPGYKSVWALNEEYGRENVTYSVAANETTYPIIQLEAEGYEVDTANSGEEALQKDVASYQLVLLDVMMGGMSGFAVARRMRDNELTRRVPIIFLTAKGAESDKVTGFNLGADDYISKPFSIREVLLRVRAVLRRTGAGKADIRWSSRASW